MESKYLRNNFWDIYEEILELTKSIRRLKFELEVNDKLIDIAYIYLKNDELFLGMVIRSIKKIAISSKCKSLLIVYFDELNDENGMIIYYDGAQDQKYVSSKIPNIIWDDVGTPKIRELSNLIKSGNFILL